MDLQHLPTTTTFADLQPVAAGYVRRLLDDGKKLTTVRQYLSKARAWCKELQPGLTNAAAAAFYPRANDEIRQMLASRATAAAARTRRAAAVNPAFLRAARSLARATNQRVDEQHALAVTIAYFFLLRPSEIVRGGKHAVRPRNVTLYRRRLGGEFVEHHHHDYQTGAIEAVALCVPHSKTDQAGDGHTIYHQKARVNVAQERQGTTRLCPVEAVVEAIRHHASASALLPMVSYPTLREFMTRVQAHGQFDRNKSWTPHGCRRGGASALFASGADALLIRKQGRWTSDAYLQYNVPSVESARGLASMMTGDLTVQ